MTTSQRRRRSSQERERSARWSTSPCADWSAGQACRAPDATGGEVGWSSDLRRCGARRAASAVIHRRLQRGADRQRASDTRASSARRRPDQAGRIADHLCRVMHRPRAFGRSRTRLRGSARRATVVTALPVAGRTQRRSSAASLRLCGSCSSRRPPCAAGRPPHRADVHRPRSRAPQPGCGLRADRPRYPASSLELVIRRSCREFLSVARIKIVRSPFESSWPQQQLLRCADRRSSAARMSPRSGTSP